MRICGSAEAIWVRQLPVEEGTVSYLPYLLTVIGVGGIFWWGQPAFLRYRMYGGRIPYTVLYRFHVEPPFDVDLS